MSDDLTDLTAEREVRREGYGGVFCTCGSAWFDAKVVIDKGGHVTGYEWPPTCADCGKTLEGTR